MRPFAHFAHVHFPVVAVRRSHLAGISGATSRRLLGPLAPLPVHTDQSRQCLHWGTSSEAPTATAPRSRQSNKENEGLAAGLNSAAHDLSLPGAKRHVNFADGDTMPPVTGLPRSARNDGLNESEPALGSA